MGLLSWKPSGWSSLARRAVLAFRRSSGNPLRQISFPMRMSSCVAAVAASGRILNFPARHPRKPCALRELSLWIAFFQMSVLLRSMCVLLLSGRVMVLSSSWASAHACWFDSSSLVFRFQVGVRYCVVPLDNSLGVMATCCCLSVALAGNVPLSTVIAAMPLAMSSIRMCASPYSALDPSLSSAALCSASRGDSLLARRSVASVCICMARW